MLFFTVQKIHLFGDVPTSERRPSSFVQGLLKEIHAAEQCRVDFVAPERSAARFQTSKRHQETRSTETYRLLTWTYKWDQMVRKSCLVDN